MLNWRIEEREFVDKEINEYYKNLLVFQRLVMNKKQMNKNINYITEQAKLKYRSKKLDNILDDVLKERKRINDLIENLNNKFDGYISEQQHIISQNIRPFEMEAKPYDNISEPTLSQLEVVTIYCKPFKLAFIQEKIGSEDK